MLPQLLLRNGKPLMLKDSVTDAPSKLNPIKCPLQGETPSKCMCMHNARMVEAKSWLEPAVELARNYRLSDRQISSIRILIETHTNEFCSAWIKHFGS